MFKRIFIHGLAAGALTAIAAFIYNRIYFFATEADFSRIVNIGSILGFSFLICMLATFLYYGFVKWLGKKGEIVFSFLFSIVSFGCVMIPISVSLPLAIKNPELFPGLAVPMAFFPCVAWFTLKPLFPIKDQGADRE
jgi:apolipoprotein N-acyltransferase